MSMEQAMERIRKQYEAYRQRLVQSDPSTEDQLIDAKMRGKVEAYEEVLKVFTGE